MRKIYTFLMGALLLLAMGSAGAQDRGCASHEVFEQMLQADPQFGINQQRLEEHTLRFIKERGVTAQVTQQGTILYRIPVVFHIVYNTSAQNISDALVLAQLQQLNQDFQKLNSDWTSTPTVYAGRVADVQVEFCLAQRDPQGNPTNGIVRRQTTVTSFSTNNAIKYTAQGGSDAWDRNQYLNIWAGNLGGGLLGYAQFPGGAAATDGVVVHVGSVGSTTTPGSLSNYGLGRTATHEVGHWLNLRHIWGDATCGNDQVDDTPAHPGSNGGCPSATLTTNCAANPGALMMWMNYMDYTYDRCMYMFTEGQKTRMLAVLASGGARASLATSQGCTPPGTGCGTPGALATSNIGTTSATLSWGTVANATSYTLEYKLSTAGSWTSIANASSPATLSGLNEGATYNWRVTAVCGTIAGSAANGPNFTTGTTPPPACPDAFEPNNTSTTPSSITPGTTISSYICTATDIDWFTFSNTKQTSNVRVTLTNPVGLNYNMRLYKPNGSLVGTTTGTNQVKSLTASGNPTGAYRVEVFGSSTQFSNAAPYSLLAQRSSTAIPAPSGARMEVIAGAEMRLAPNPTRSELNISFGADWQGTATVTLSDLTGRNVLTSQMQATGTNTLQVGHLGRGIYMLKATNGTLSSMQKVMIVQ